ncbi:MAG TPA: hypothetical protein VGO18_15840, partial [Steroidobacteraceae bacterium]|nr:hypothetical protein [Steroidobacteraceae bacterium]
WSVFEDFGAATAALWQIRPRFARVHASPQCRPWTIVPLTGSVLIRPHSGPTRTLVIPLTSHRFAFPTQITRRELT